MHKQKLFGSTGALLTQLRTAEPANKQVLLDLAAKFPQRYPVLLQSNAIEQPFASEPASTPHQANSRWSILGISNGQTIDPDKDFFAQLQQSIDQVKNTTEAMLEASEELPFFGGWMVYLGYELAAEIEPKLKLPRTHYQFPRAFAWRTPAALIFDQQESAIWLVSESSCAQWLPQLAADLTELSASLPLPQACQFAISEDAPERFLQGVQSIKEYLLAGDVFQVNLSREWQAKASCAFAPAQLFNSLSLANPSPFSALVQWPNAAIVSSSPERLVSVDHTWVQTRPIAGTRARTSQTDNQHQTIKELVGDLKERAEHIMLIDLERNDLGRICQPGTVQANELLSVESYAHVHHIVSNVRGKLKPAVRATDVLKAVFPGGTITGCPKVRCMEIIAELEQTGRGPYTGAVGYIGVDGRMDFNILIRSFAQCGQTLYFRAGAGIVADSQAERELAETRAKAKGLLRALHSSP